MIRIPTIAEFNNWIRKEKHRWIAIESKGIYKKMDRAKGYFPLIIYGKVNVGIVYQVNSKGQIIECVAMTVKAALDRLARFDEASKAMMGNDKN